MALCCMVLVADAVIVQGKAMVDAGESGAGLARANLDPRESHDMTCRVPVAALLL